MTWSDGEKFIKTGEIHRSLLYPGWFGIMLTMVQKVSIFVFTIIASFGIAASAAEVSVQESRLTGFQIVEAPPELPNEGVSFTSLLNENVINLSAQITPAEFHTAYSTEIQWIVDDDPLVNGVSPDLVAPQNGASTLLIVQNIPLVPAGRGYPLNYRIRAKVNIEGGVAIDTCTIKQDEIDQARQEYIDMSKATTPARDEFSNFGQSTEGHFTFAELNSGDFTWAIVKDALYAGLESLRSAVGNTPLIITSGYRNPRHNLQKGGALESRHIDAGSGTYIFMVEAFKAGKNNLKAARKLAIIK